MQLTPDAAETAEPDTGKADPRQRSQHGGRGLWLFHDLVMALRFFSRLPTGSSPHIAPDLGRIAVVLPLAALIMGAVPVLVFLAGAMLGLPAYFSATLAVAAMVLVGGAMSEDALADAADGLFGGQTATRRLEILKDSRHGSYGVAALCLFLVLRVTAIGSLGAAPLAAVAIWLAANLVARSGALWLSTALPAARPDGAAAAAGPLPRAQFCIGAAFAAFLGVAIAGPWIGIAGTILAFAAVAAIVVAWAALCRRLVGGQTGDLVGAAAALAEIGALTTMLIFT